MNLLFLVFSFFVGAGCGAAAVGIYFKKKIESMMQDPMKMAEAAGNMMGDMFPDDIQDS